MEDDTIDAIRRALDHDREEARRDTAVLHQLEAWRERLLVEGDSALAELLQAHPHPDRQHLRQLVRNAKEERLKNKPLHAYRELFRELRLLMRDDSEAMESDDAEAFGEHLEDHDPIDVSDEGDDDSDPPPRSRRG